MARATKHSRQETWQRRRKVIRSQMRVRTAGTDMSSRLRVQDESSATCRENVEGFYVSRTPAAAVNQLTTRSVLGGHICKYRAGEQQTRTLSSETKPAAMGLCFKPHEANVKGQSAKFLQPDFWRHKRTTSLLSTSIATCVPWCVR